MNVIDLLAVCSIQSACSIQSVIVTLEIQSFLTNFSRLNEALNWPR